MVVLTRCDDHVSGLVEERRIHRQAMLIVVQALLACRIFHYVMEMGVVGRREQTNVPNANRPSQRGGKDVPFIRMHVDLLSTARTANTVFTFFGWAWKQDSIAPLRVSTVITSLRITSSRVWYPFPRLTRNAEGWSG